MTNFWIEKFNIDDLSEIDNIDKLNLKNLKCFDFDGLFGQTQQVFDGTIDLENINIISEGDIEYDATQIKTIQNTRLLIKMSECQLFAPGDSLEINKIPELFFKKKNLVIIKNLNDNKCFLWCFIRKYLNPIEKIFLELIKKTLKFQKN